MHSLRRVYLITSILYLTGASLFGCGGGGASTPPTVGQAGGTITSADRSASLTFPAGALGHDVVITLEPGMHSSNLDPFTPSSTPPNLVKFSGVDGRSSRMHSNSRSGRTADTQLVVYTAKYPADFNIGAGSVYLNRSDLAEPVFLQSTFNPQSQTVTAKIPITLLHTHLDKTVEDAGDFEPVPQLTLGLSQEPSHLNEAASVKVGNYTGSPTAYAEQSDWSAAYEGERIAIVVHGTWSSPQDMAPLADYLAQFGYVNSSDKLPYFNRVLGIEYNWKASPDENGALLAAKLQHLTDRKARVYLFAHSQGGLVCRWAIEKAGANQVTMLVMFGVPNMGIPRESIWTATKLRTGGSGDPAFVAMSNYPPDGFSPFLQALNDAHAPDQATYYTVCGNAQARDFDIDILSIPHLLYWDGPDDGVVYESSVRTGENGHFLLSQYCKGGYDDNHNLEVHMLHTELTNILSFATQDKLKFDNWIRQQSLGTANVNIH